MSNINLEFFADTNGTVYVQTEDGSCRIVTERDRELISDVIKRISEIHPKTYDALMKQYAKSNRNKWFQEFLAFQRFVRCNWGNHDRSTQDVGATGVFHYEHVSCPMRGECPLENVVCHPEIDTNLSEREKEVLTLIADGLQAQDIADRLCISINTVNRHRENIKIKTGTRSVAELTTWYYKNLHHE